MFVETRAINFPLTDAIQSYTESRAQSALAPVCGRIFSVTVRLDDVNAGRGGVDKRCRLVATVRRRGVIAAEATDADLYTAIDSAASRLARAARESVRRMVRRDRRNRQRPGAWLRV